MDDEFIRQGQFRALLYAWLGELKKADLSPATIHKYREAVSQFYDWCHRQEDPILLGDVKRQDVIDWQTDQVKTYSSSTVNQRLAALRSFYDFLLDRELVNRNPAHRLPGTRKAGEKPRKRGELTDDQIRLLLQPWGRGESIIRDLAILHLMAYCALRSSEINRLDFEDITAQDDRLLLWVWGRGRIEPDSAVTLPEAAEEALRDWLINRPGEAGGPLFVSLSRRGPGRRLTVGYIRRMVQRRLRRIGATGSAESIRAAAIKNAIRHGGNPMKVRRMARHKKIETTLDYWKDREDQPVEDLISYEPDPNE